MRIVAGAWRGRTLVAPPGQATRPTADRVRQALFDMLVHAEWGGRAVIEGAAVLDVFAGTGALGLEALSRGATSACFIESDHATLRALRANIAACKAEDWSEILAVDAREVSPVARPARANLRHPAPLETTPRLAAGPHPVPTQGRGPIVRCLVDHSRLAGSVSEMPAAGTRPHDPSASLVFLDPPYRQDLVPVALRRLREAGRIRSGALIVAETGRDEAWVPEQLLLAERQYGATRVLVFRAA